MTKVNNNGKSFGQSTVENSMHSLGSVLAGIAALLSAGHIWQFTADPVYGYLVDSFQNEGLATLSTYVYGVLSVLGVYFICRAVFILTLMVLVQQVLFRFVF